jgi:hypothetical protein
MPGGSAVTAAALRKYAFHYPRAVLITSMSYVDKLAGRTSGTKKSTRSFEFSSSLQPLEH